MKALLLAVFRYFASLNLAIVLLLLLALVFAAGTILESLYGAEAAKILVYQNHGLTFLLVLLALNVAASALDRLPWQKRHVGFVVTHGGILLLLTGSLLTQTMGIEGQMAVEEGEESSRMVLAEPVMQLLGPSPETTLSYRIPGRAFFWRGKERLLVEGEKIGGSLSPEVTLLQFYPKASREENLRPSETGPSAIYLTLESSVLQTSHWLVLDDPGASEINLGPALIRFSREKMLPPAPRPEKEKSWIEFHFEGGKIVQVPLPEKLPKEISLEGTPYRVTVLRLLRDAVVEVGAHGDTPRLVDRSEEWRNPACELRLEGNGISETHTLFANFPDFQTIHSREPSKAGAEIFLKREGGSPADSQNELRLIWQADGPLSYQVRKGGQISEGTAEVGQTYETGWMDFKFKVEHFYPHSERHLSFREEPLRSEKEGHVSAVEVEFRNGEERRQFWLSQGEHKTVTLGGKPLEVIYGFRNVPVGFRIGLKDFRIETYPGTNRPASFESDVVLKDDFSGETRSQTIRMNQPLKHRGFKIFQSGYQLPEGAPEISVFSVAKDPGIPLKYLGAMVLVSGCLMMFYLRKFSTKGSNHSGISIGTHGTP